MKNRTITLRHLLLLSVIFTGLLTSCSRKMVFAPSTVVPAATGKVKYKKDKNGNYAIDVNVLHLAPPSSLTPPRDTYVVWIETAGNGVKNLGKINSSSGLLSKTLKASLETTTPYEPRNFFITAENQPETSYPSPEMVLRTR
jgi:hypothetical protein